MKPDEFALLLAFLAAPKHQLGPALYEATVAQLGMPARRAEYLLRKWTKHGWFDYGVTQRSGWLTEEGAKAARASLPAESKKTVEKSSLPPVSYASLRADENRKRRASTDAEDQVLDEGAAAAVDGLRSWARGVFKEQGLVPYRDPANGLMRYDMQQSLMVPAMEPANGWRQVMGVEKLLKDVETGDPLAEPRDVLVIADFCDPSTLPSNKLLNPHTPFRPSDPAFRWCDECLGINGSHDPGCPHNPETKK